MIHRATDGYVHFPLRDIYGRRTLPAMDIVRHALTDAGKSELAFVAMLDGDERRGGAVWGDVSMPAASTSSQAAARPARPAPSTSTRPDRSPRIKRPRPD